MMEEINALTEKIIGAAIEVHRELGPGLLESTYKACLAHELRSQGVVVEVEKETIIGVREKPKISYLASAGIYVLNPAICDVIKANEYLDMPDLIAMNLKQNRRIFPFLLHEYWQLE